MKVPLGIGPPNPLEDTVYAWDLRPELADLTTVTGVQLDVWIPSGAGGALVQNTWSASIISAVAPAVGVPSTLTWQHIFQTTDCTVVGEYLVTAYLTVPGFPFAIPCPPTKPLRVVPPHKL